MKLYNTKTLQTELFTPIKKDEVSMYVCGPTVYGHAHIGNARPIIVFDTLKRTLEANGYLVKYVSNFTDVDDKIIKKANDEKVSEEVITKQYIDAYNDVRYSLNTLPLFKTPKVTETMDDIICFIEELVKQGNAYEIEGDVYFSVDSIEDYGSLSKQNVEDLRVGARIEENKKKKNPLDFALWKKTDMGLRWETNFSCGRPGWHTECVVMIQKELGSKIDIHGGGMDLKFPHHENEVAQAKAIHHNSIANFWVHNAMINVEGEKMSKSLGNIRNAKDVIKELGAPLVRWLMLSVHYRKELNFTDETISTSKTELEKVLNSLKQARLKLALSDFQANNKDIDSYNLFLDAMNDDLNTPNAYTVIYDLVKLINQTIRTKEVNYELLAKYLLSLEAMLDILGIEYPTFKLDSDSKQIFKQWELAKADKDFNKADEYRKVLIERGYL